MCVRKEVLLSLCELYPKSAIAIKEMALEKAKIKMKLFELSNYTNGLSEKLIKNPNDRSAFYYETINQI
jgi:hypothetical protein